MPGGDILQVSSPYKQNAELTVSFLYVDVYLYEKNRLQRNSISVADPYGNISVRIRIRIRLQILLFLPVTFKIAHCNTATKYKKSR